MTRRPWLFPVLGLLAGLCISSVPFALPSIACAGPMVDDPKGFHGIPWGAALAESSTLVLSESGEHVNGYHFKDGPPPLGEATVESLRLFTYDGSFARVSIRYRGRTTHDQVMRYLQSHFGPIDLAPGSMMRGLNQQYNWRGTDTEVNVTYEEPRELGFLFIESRVWGARFNDSLPEHGY